MMGHADIKTTNKIYTHLDTDDILSEIEKYQLLQRLQANYQQVRAQHKKLPKKVRKTPLNPMI